MKQIIQFIIPLLFLAIVIGAVIYLSNRLGWAFGLSSKWLYLGFGVSIISIFVIIGVFMNTNPTSTISHIISNISTIGLGVLTILLLTLLVIDAIGIFYKFTPNLFGIIVLSLTTIVTLYTLWNAQNVRVVHQDIKLARLQQPIKIAQLSDIHIGHFWGKKSLQKQIDKIKKENVDVVVITGDLFDGRVRLNSDVLSPFKDLAVPIYFVSGNHDSYTGESEIKNLLDQNGVIILSNKLTEVKGLQIIGLDYMPADEEGVDMMHHTSSSNTTIKDELSNMGINPEFASILLHHNPIGINYANQHGIGLYLAGHTHGGQLFPATIIAKLMFGYNKGLYETQKDGTLLYVSQGSGSFGPPMRLGTFSEITIFNLTPKSN